MSGQDIMGKRREHKVGDLVACKEGYSYVLGTIVAIQDRRYQIEWADGDNAGPKYYFIDIDNFKSILQEYKSVLKNG